MGLITRLKSSLSDTYRFGELDQHGRYIFAPALELCAIFSNPVITDAVVSIKTSDPDIVLVVSRFPTSRILVYSLSEGSGIYHRVVMFENRSLDGKMVTQGQAENDFLSDWNGYVLKGLRKASVVALLY